MKKQMLTYQLIKIIARKKGTLNVYSFFMQNQQLSQAILLVQKHNHIKERESHKKLVPSHKKRTLSHENRQGSHNFTFYSRLHHINC